MRTNTLTLRQINKAELSKQIEEIESSFGSRKGLISRLTGYDFEKGQNSLRDAYDP